VLWCKQCIFTGNIEFIESNIMQKHIDTTQVVGCDIDFLTVKSITDSVLAKNFLSLQKQ
jgi:hypothetical protein